METLSKKHMDNIIIRKKIIRTIFSIPKIIELDSKVHQKEIIRKLHYLGNG